MLSVKSEYGSTVGTEKYKSMVELYMYFTE